MNVKCANCPSKALFHVNDPGAVPANFCRNCLPAHLVARAEAGEFTEPTEGELFVDDPGQLPVRRTRRSA